MHEGGFILWVCRQCLPQVHSEGIKPQHGQFSALVHFLGSSIASPWLNLSAGAAISATAPAHHTKDKQRHTQVHGVKELVIVARSVCFGKRFLVLR